MTAHSALRYYEAVKDTSLDDDRALSAWRAWLARDTIMHLCDSAGQYRVNWADGVGLNSIIHYELGVEENPTFEYQIRTFDFPLTFRSLDAAFSLDIRVGTKLVGDCLEAEVYAALMQIEHGDNTAFSDSSTAVLWFNAATVTEPTASWSIDTLKTWNKNEAPIAALLRAFTVKQDSREELVVVPMIRLQVGIRGTEFDSPSAQFSGAAIVGVQVRECP